MRRASSHISSVALLFAVGCGHGLAGPPKSEEAAVRIEVDRDRVVAELDPRFLSVALDTAQVFGGAFWSPGGAANSVRGDVVISPLDLSRLDLQERLRSLAPTYLRIGGTAADLVSYELGGERSGRHSASDGLRLTAGRWQEIVAFANAGDAQLIFTLSAGPATRDARGAWKADQAATLVEHATRRGDPVAVWELGNEINAYPITHGIGHSVSGRQLGRDLTAARAMLDRVGSPARLAAPASAFWPVIGEFHPVMARALRHAGRDVQIVTWHYYPQQSRRCPVAVRRASVEQLLRPVHLDELARWARLVERARAQYAPSAELWLGETGNAQCGGEPGVSDAMAGTLWWIDELGALARAGHRVVVRQTLVGSDYGLLDEETLDGRPDYWASILWKRVMGLKVLSAAAPGNTLLRLYAHCAAQGPPGAVALAIVNLDRFGVPEVRVSFPSDVADLYVLRAPALGSAELEVNGVRPEDAGAMAPITNVGPLRIPPLSVTFAVFPGAAAPACFSP